ncbi:MAG TPA: metal ABC transporter ATP-binding protein [Terriglobales bacterium]|nr:metal ABC transporter ATP-binding protein [Terriglobales bacterium]
MLNSVTDKHSHKPVHATGSFSLEITDLTVRFGNQVALESLSLEIEPGLRVSVVGPNGAGKSTLFSVIAGVLPASSGKVKVYGHGPAEDICIAYVTQSTELDWTFPVSLREVVMMGRAGQLGLLRRPGPRDREIVDQSLKTVQLLHLAGRQIGELSGGQKQRLLIARALAQEADLVLLDEPLAGLDLPSQEQIFTILDELRTRHVTVLFATHDLELASSHFDRILLLNSHLIAYGDRKEVLTGDHLAQAYGGRMETVDTDQGKFIIADSGGHHGHEGEGRHG